MKGVFIGLLLAIGSLLMILFAYASMTSIAKIEDALTRWAKKNDLRIVHKETRTFFQGPFFLDRYRPVYYLTVEDQQHRRRKAWIRLGWWYFIGFKECVEVIWEQ